MPSTSSASSLPSENIPVRSKSRVRPHSPVPAESRKKLRQDSNDHKSRQQQSRAEPPKTAKVIDQATDLALDHLLVLGPNYPLNGRSVQQVLDWIGDKDHLATTLTDRLACIARRVRDKDRGLADVSKQEQVISRVHEEWMKKVLKHMVETLETGYNLPRDTRFWELAEASKSYKVELKITPVVHLDEDEDEKESTPRPHVPKAVAASTESGIPSPDSDIDAKREGGGIKDEDEDDEWHPKENAATQRILDDRASSLQSSDIQHHDAFALAETNRKPGVNIQPVPKHALISEDTSQISSQIKSTEVKRGAEDMFRAEGRMPDPLPDVQAYGHGRWLLIFATETEADARSAAGESIFLRGRRIQFDYFSVPRPMVFFCRQVSSILDPDTVVRRLVNLFPTYDMFLQGGCRNGPESWSLAITFDRPVDMERFMINIKRLGPGKGNATFNAYLGETRCKMCNGPHLVHTCGQLRPLVPVGQRPPSLMSVQTHNLLNVPEQ